MHQDQLTRIKGKLKKARRKDFWLKVFGARSHRYKVGRCLTPEEIREFEDGYDLKLPDCYRSFLLEVGNGGISHAGSAAGPFYGIYPLGKYVDEIIDSPEQFLRIPPAIQPNMSDEHWSGLSKKINGDDDLSDEKFDAELNRLYSGILPLGSQGCAFLHGLVVAGEHSGKVVNIDLDRTRPRFCFEENFLDWYERWLDEILSGILLADSAGWFGYTMGGDARALLKVFDGTQDPDIRHEALIGMGKLLTADQASCDRLLDISESEDKKLANSATMYLAKFSYQMAKAKLGELIDGDDDDCLAACQSLFWYQRKHARDWEKRLRKRLSKVNEIETFRFVTYLLDNCGADYAAEIIPCCKHPHESIRAESYYQLGKLKNKGDYIRQIAVGLSDPSGRVVHAALQALSGVTNRSLYREYYKVAQRYPVEKDHVLVNLNHRLKELGFEGRSDFISRYDPDSDEVNQH